MNEQFRGRRCGALAFFWIDGSPHERIDQILKQGSLDGTQFGWIKLEQQMLLVIFDGFPERSLFMHCLSGCPVMTPTGDVNLKFSSDKR